MRIVHIDDDRGYLEFVSRCIADMSNHEVYSFASTNEFVKWMAASNEEPTLYIVDGYIEDEQSGIEITKIIASSRHRAHSLIALLSNSNKQILISRAYEAGVNFYLEKRMPKEQRGLVERLIRFAEVISFPSGYQSSPSGNDTESNTTKQEGSIDLSSTEVPLTRFDRSEPARLLTQTILVLIEDHREKIYGDNEINTDERRESLAALEELERVISSSDKIVQSQQGKGEFRSAQTTIWIDEFNKALAVNVKRTFQAENLANATVPTAIILSCASLGLLVGGPLGMGAGSLLGHLVTGQMKPGLAATKISDAITEAGPSNQP